MIAAPLRSLLVANGAINTLTQGRITPIQAGQAEGFPSLFFSTADMTPVPCRVSGGLYGGQVELTVLALDVLGIDALTLALRTLLDNQTITAEGFSIDFEPGISADEGKDEGVYFRRLDFSVFAQRL